MDSFLGGRNRKHGPLFECRAYAMTPASGIPRTEPYANKGEPAPK